MYERSLNERQARLDWGLVAALLGLMLVGTAFIDSATLAHDNVNGLAWYHRHFFHQIVWYAVGIIGAAGLCVVDYRLFARWSLVIYWTMILLLMVVLIPGIGTYRFGARRWIDFGALQFQPSEFAKLAFILVMAHFLSRPTDELRQPPVFWRAFGLTVLPFLLILKEPDLGSALVFLPVGLAMLFVAGAPPHYLKLLVAGFGLLFALLLVDILFTPPGWWHIKLEDYQRRRLLVYFGLDFAPPHATEAERQRARLQQLNDSYNVRQALISVGSGGLTGKGWRQGTQSALGYLPRAVAHNDFIFSVIAEEKGFLGSVAVLALYTVVLFSGIRIAGQARDRLGKLLAVGVVTLLFSHVFINIGMNIRIMPVTGIPLPLLSYGGSSVICSLFAAGLLQNVYLYRKSY